MTRFTCVGKPVQYNFSRKTYNNIDSNEQLMYVEVTKNKFAGYRPELLVYSLNEVETDFYVCTECKGVMRNACQTGEEQNPVCKVCIKDEVLAISMVKSRNKILELQAKCPIATRGCNWNGKMAEVEEHLIVCDKVVVKCTNACDVILPRCELKLHLTSFCVKRPVICEHCIQYFMYKELTNHYLTCLEYQMPCPFNCSVDLKRKLLDSHLELECPNKVVECPYKKYGCGQKVLRRDLEEHKKINQIQHLESTSIFAIREMEQLKQTNLQLTETNMQLTETNMQLTETNMQLTETNMQLTERNMQITKMNRQLSQRVTTLENEVDMSSYPIILCDEIAIPTYIIDPSITTVTKKVDWRCKLSVRFELIKNNKFISVFVKMDDDDIKTLEGRFKLTVIDKNYKSYIYESRCIKLQPENLLENKGPYPTEFTIAKIPFESSGSVFFDTKLKFILQAQEIENQ